MNRQKSFENDKPTLYLVPTPIGNLSEMSPRAVEVLKSVDVIACEDTRTSGQLLKHFEIKNRLITYQNFNEDPAAKGIINLLSQGHNVALISDAGYPLISDPGQRVVSEASAMGFNVVPLSGPNAMLNALVASGLVVQPFLFTGFLPAGRTDCLKKLREYRSYPMTLIFYEAPHRIEKMMKNCLEVLGDRRCCIARELTKMHEEFLRGTIRELLPELAGLKGEM
ncbi:MAG: 16S rRNA (cytidine(1402)-2'-O)-methyltransferase, partial [Solobacterium sp.]|nr:16S rRNA (cytidine(1402)-2'-O)-methyltransferase [Solobacterium sp.]